MNDTETTKQHWAYHIERKQAKQKHSTETKSVGNTNSTKKRRLTRVLINGLLPCWLIFKIVILLGRSSNLCK
jgi:ABC-type nickel/cobalt efflux system permease component RcnA